MGKKDCTLFTNDNFYNFDSYINKNLCKAFLFYCVLITDVQHGG